MSAATPDAYQPSPLDRARTAVRDAAPKVQQHLGQLADFHGNRTATQAFRKDSGVILEDAFHWIVTPSISPEPGNLQQLREATYAAVRKANATMEWWYWILARAVIGHPLLTVIGTVFGGLFLMIYCLQNWYYITRALNLVSPIYWYHQYELHQLYHQLGYA